MHFLPLLFVSLFGVGGWLIGRNNPRKKEQKKQNTLSKDYFVGLNYLLNEQSDQAVDVFIRMVDVDPNTVETHMALGSIFRRRGETNRAIRIHQNIIARPNLSKELRLQALQELGRDYMAAGVYDRAERLFLEAVETGGKHRVQSLKFLIDIYEREKDWIAALERTEQYQKITGEDRGIAIAQYYCEIIEDPRQHLSHQQIDEYLKLAFAADKNCLRAGILKAKQECGAEEEGNAIRIYQKLIKQDPDFMPIILPLLQKAYQKNNDEKGFVDFLLKVLDDHPKPQLIVMIAEKLQAWHGATAAIEFLQKQLHEHPSLQAIEYLVALQTEFLDGDIKEQAELLQRYLHKVSLGKTRYLCEHCGYQSKKMNWLCPSCRRWGVVKPEED